MYKFMNEVDVEVYNAILKNWYDISAVMSLAVVEVFHGCCFGFLNIVLRTKTDLSAMRC